MKISLQWLQEWVDTGTDVPALAHALTMAGLEIEGIERAAPPLSGIVVGEVKSVTKHPDAEKLNVCRVWNGREELQIVCGAPNVRTGMKAPLALVGGRHRFRLLVHGERRSDMQAFLRSLLQAAPKPRGSVRVQVDIDPQSFL